MSFRIFGIRHHGPGSARSLRQALESLRPDIVLIEGPPEADELVPLAAHAEMEPPVALLVYNPDQPQQSVYYPFAAFSPEWQAMRYALAEGVAVRFMDLPQAHWLALKDESQISNSELEISADPLKALAEAAGYSDSELWWEHQVEQRRDGAGLFDALREAMAALREGAPIAAGGVEEKREAFMRQMIRAALKEGFERVAVVCGAWHAPALDVSGEGVPAAKDDAAALKGLPKVKVKATWVPWTNGRLTLASGYGAGVESPGWYRHLWEASAKGGGAAEVTIEWMARVARLLRDEDLDASSASVIEAVRLAESLAALRGRPLPGLPELNEATLTVLCFGDELPLRLIHEKLIVGEVLGDVPEETPAVPLEQDLRREQKRLRFPAEAAQKTVDFDLRKETDLQRSHLLHRLRLLGVAWGELEQTGGKRGTFHEIWRVEWRPEFAVKLIEAGVWGSTIVEAATNSARGAADKAADLPTLTKLVDAALLADLAEAVAHVMARLQAEAAVSSDVAHLMDALPPLVNVMRYGNVRQTDVAAVSRVVDGLLTRVCIGLPGACASLNDEAAAEMFGRVGAVSAAVTLLQNEDHQAAWHGVLARLADQQGLHGLIAGRCCRLLLDAGRFTAEDAATRLSLALSAANDPPQAAAWVEGFLKGSGLLLLHDGRLWGVIDEWVTAMPGEQFTALLPLLRRTFATFPAPERRQMGERVRGGKSRGAAGVASAAGFDAARAEAVLPLVARLLGLRFETEA
jgi:hypothetical protein